MGGQTNHLAEKVFTCYEAGPFGYDLHRKLEKMGVVNYVVRPRDWDEYGQKVKTDKRDAKQLALHLDRYVNGNQDAFCVVQAFTIDTAGAWWCGLGTSGQAA